MFKMKQINAMPKLSINASFLDKDATNEIPIIFPIPPNSETPLITLSRSLLRKTSIVKASKGISTEIIIVSSKTITAKSDSCRNISEIESKVVKPSRTSATSIKAAYAAMNGLRRPSLERQRSRHSCKNLQFCN